MGSHQSRCCAYSEGIGEMGTSIIRRRLTDVRNIGSIRDSHHLYPNQRSDQGINMSAIPTRVP